MADESSGEKTEEATPKKRDEAREKGQVAMSNEFVVALMLIAAIASFLVLGGGLARSAGVLVVDGAKRASELCMSELAVQDASALLTAASAGVARSLAIILAPVLLVGFLVSYGQIGVQLTPKAMETDLNKLNPVSGWKKIFGPRGFMRTGLGLLKILLIASVVAAVTWFMLPEFSQAAGTDAKFTVGVIGRVVLRAVASGALVILALSLIDLVYQRFQHSKDLKMSKKEVKDEAKNSEGDPQVKARIRQVQREMAMNRMMADVPEADAVVMNPTHFAVALRYRDGEDAAPRVVAKGMDHLALRIRDLARESEVAVIEDPPLARALHRACEIGEHVPEELFEAVARLLAYVYRMEGRATAAATD